MNLFEVGYMISTGNARFVLQRYFVGYSTIYFVVCLFEQNNI